MHSNIPEDAIQVTFDQVTSFTAKFGNESSGATGYFGVTFEPLSAVYPAATPADPVANPSNRPPTSDNTIRYIPDAEPWTIQDVDFGAYADPDLNPLAKVKIVSLPTSGSLEKYVGGAWVPVVAGDDIAIADIENGNLRFTGAVDDQLSFQVNDGLAYSNATYTMDLLMSTQGQTITFGNPGQKAPTDPAFASGATPSSGLTVVLESLTHGVCTVSGLDITPVAEVDCTIVARQPGDRTWGAADPVTQTFPISTKTAQTITAPSPGNCTIRNTQPGNATYAPAPPVEYTFVVSNVVAYTLTYDANGVDSGTVPGDQMGSGNVTVAGNTGTLVRSGYTAGGWTISSTTYAGGATYDLQANVTAYAIWNPVYTLTYDATGADGAPPLSIDGNGMVAIAPLGNLVRPGYTFKGWSINDTIYQPGDSFPLTEDVMAFARGRGPARLPLHPAPSAVLSMRYVRFATPLHDISHGPSARERALSRDTPMYRLSQRGVT